MAEKLTPLVGMGDRVFHDLQVDWLPGMKFNIDHIAVGSNGVFVIETKTRRKRNDALPEGTEDYKMKAVPEPSTIWMMLIGAVGLMIRRKR